MTQFYVTSETLFDVHNTVLTADGTGFPDGTEAFSLSFWANFSAFFPFETVGVTAYTADGSQAVLGATLSSSGAYSVIIWQDSGNQVTITGAATVRTPGINNMLASYDGNETVTITINDVNYAVAGLGGPLVVFTPRAWHITAPACDALVADVWANPTFLDFTDPTNCQKFIEVDGVTPVDLGSTGSGPLGFPPAIWMREYSGGVPADFGTNHGAGGGSWASTNTLVNTCGSPPPPTNDLIEQAAGPVSLGRWRTSTGINWYGMALVGDAYSGVLGLSDFEAFTEYGNPMRFLITTPPVHEDRKRIFVPRFEIEVEAGTGIDGQPTTVPKMLLEWSKDGGVTWSTLKPPRSMGLIGEYIKRLRWLNLGNSRTWVFRLTCTDPVRRYVIGAYITDYKSLG